MTEERATYTAGWPTYKLAITLTVDVDDDLVAGYLAGQVNANPPTKERGADPLSLDFATLDFLLDAIAPTLSKERGNGDGDDFVDLYHGRQWLRELRLSAKLSE